MRADNSHHVIAAAHRRAAATRKRAVAALRRMDKSGLLITFDSVAKHAQVSRSWLYTQPDLRAEIERRRAEEVRLHRASQFPFGSAHPTHRCCAGWRPQPTASDGWKRKTSSFAKRSPWPWATAERAMSSAAPPTRRGRNLKRSSALADDRVIDTVLSAFPQVKSMIIFSAQDNAPIPATFCYAGISLERTGLFSGTRGEQIAGRFGMVRTSPFEQDPQWTALIAALEDSLRLHCHQPGTLNKLDRYLHQRTHGMIGGLLWLIRSAAINAVLDGTEKITKKSLDAVEADITSQSPRPPAT